MCALFKGVVYGASYISAIHGNTSQKREFPLCYERTPSESGCNFEVGSEHRSPARRYYLHFCYSKPDGLREEENMDSTKAEAESEGVQLERR